MASDVSETSWKRLIIKLPYCPHPGYRQPDLTRQRHVSEMTEAEEVQLLNLSAQKGIQVTLPSQQKTHNKLTYASPHDANETENQKGTLEAGSPLLCHLTAA